MRLHAPLPGVLTAQSAGSATHVHEVWHANVHNCTPKHTRMREYAHAQAHTRALPPRTRDVNDGDDLKGQHPVVLDAKLLAQLGLLLQVLQGCAAATGSSGGHAECVCVIVPAACAQLGALAPAGCARQDAAAGSGGVHVGRVCMKLPAALAQLGAPAPSGTEDGRIAAAGSNGSCSSSTACSAASPHKRQLVPAAVHTLHGTQQPLCKPMQAHASACKPIQAPHPARPSTVVVGCCKEAWGAGGGRGTKRGSAPAGPVGGRGTKQ